MVSFGVTRQQWVKTTKGDKLELTDYLQVEKQEKHGKNQIQV